MNVFCWGLTGVASIQLLSFAAMVFPALRWGFWLLVVAAVWFTLSRLEGKQEELVLGIIFLGAIAGIVAGWGK
jgi:hypothetical protein